MSSAMKISGIPSMNFGFCVLWRISSMVKYIAGAPPSADSNNNVFSLTRQLPLTAACLSWIVTMMAIILMMIR